MPVVRYDSVIVPSALYCKVMVLIKRRTDLGYWSVAGYIAESIRAKLSAVEATKP